MRPGYRESMVGAVEMLSRPQLQRPSGGPPAHPGPFQYLELEAFASLLGALRGAGYTPIGPVLRDGAVIYAELGSIEDLPRGWTDRQEGGRYRLERRQDDAFFGYAAGPYSWKSFLFPPSLRLWSAERKDADVRFVPAEEPASKLAFIGVRACELNAMAIQDRVFLEGPFADPVYRARREAALIIAVQCGSPGGTCFCASLEMGPRAERGFDLALTEVLEGSYEHERWAEVAKRCLACGNCTSVCPTCFCSTVDDVSSLSGAHAERWRRWDSCFTTEHSYIHGGEVRRSVASRYRQWLMHKFRTWVDQFGTMGCVGCGRCITWCPVGIDLTEELAAFRSAVRRRSSGTMLVEKGSAT